MTLARRILARPVARIVLFFALFAAMQVVAALVVAWLLPEKSGGKIAYIGGNAYAAATAVLCFWLMTRFADKRPWCSTGFVTRGFVSETLAGYLIGMALLSVVIGVMATFGAYHFVGTNLRFMIATPLSMFLFVAITEETLFRGYFFQTLEARWGTGIALTVTSLFFGLTHLANPIAGITFPEKLFSAVCIVFEAGILLGAAYVATRRLWLPIGLHWAWNFFEGPFYGTRVSGETLTSSYIISKTSGPFLLTGGAFGPEGSAICLIVCTIAGTLLLRIAIKNGQWRSSESIRAVNPSAQEAPIAPASGHS
jgi:membrane protease YdiL (CAAX protease family)